MKQNRPRECVWRLRCKEHLLEIPLQRFEGARLKPELIESIFLGICHSITIAIGRLQLDSLNS